ncbi:hypothetical protein K461DRAFT_308940 [Myriangium duriaei CBS 260.36]|uniref:Uncharacterized protein n=1 Tax=Myriangium duriaei CBS 260.36 TaxID=1168546 RepID=A0A9P4J7A3_9PEZI|nr:hypothetical protein K461DRAFT_308940 [Myriangium duriaei CBS 260.36]
MTAPVSSMDPGQFCSGVGGVGDRKDTANSVACTIPDDHNAATPRLLKHEVCPSLGLNQSAKTFRSSTSRKVSYDKYNVPEDNPERAANTPPKVTGISEERYASEAKAPTKRSRRRTSKSISLSAGRPRKAYLPTQKSSRRRDHSKHHIVIRWQTEDEDADSESSDIISSYTTSARAEPYYNKYHRKRLASPIAHDSA